MKDLYDLNYKESAELFVKVAEKYLADFTVQAIQSRPDCDEWTKGSANYLFTHKTGFTGFYSMGLGHFEQSDVVKAARVSGVPGHGLDLRLAKNIVSGKSKFSDPAMMQSFCYNMAKTRKPPLTDILSSLFMDAGGSDQDFEEWASDCGYSTDSIKAKEIWEACNKNRRFLQRNISPNDFEQLAVLANQL